VVRNFASCALDVPSCENPSAMPTICPGVDYDTVAREWRCKWSEDSDKASLQELQKALTEAMPKISTEGNPRDVRRIVCGSCKDFKVVMSLPADKFSAWEEKKFAPEEEFLETIKKIKGVSAVETQTYTTMPVKKPPPPPKLKKARTGKIGKLNPDSKGFTIEGNLMDAPKAVEGKPGFFEVTLGDASGKVTCSLKDFQVEAIKGAKAAIFRNAKVLMVGGHIRLTVDKWGKVESSDDVVETVGDKNVSETEFELVKA